MTNKKMKLLCIPCAGGLSVSYLKWKPYLSDSLEFHLTDYAGHGTRLDEPFFDSLDDIIDDYFSTYKSFFRDNYCFFGHSMGCTVAYELYYRIKHENMTPPAIIFLAGRNPPDIKPKNILHNLCDEEFITETIKLGGTPEEILKTKEYHKIFLPILKSDYKAIETYQYEKKKSLLSCDITYLLGTEDHLVTSIAAENWKSFTDGSFELFEFSGGHFFVFEQIKEITEIINRKISSILSLSV